MTTTEADRETAYRVLEVARWINAPSPEMAIYERRLSACHDACAEERRPPRIDPPCNTIIIVG